ARLNGRDERRRPAFMSSFGESMGNIFVLFGVPQIKRDIHEAAANLNLILFEVACKIDRHDAVRDLLIEQWIGAAQDFALTASSADCAERLTLWRNHHFGADFARNRAACADDRRQDEGLSFSQ